MKRAEYTRPDSIHWERTSTQLQCTIVNGTVPLHGIGIDTTALYAFQCIEKVRSGYRNEPYNYSVISGSRNVQRCTDQWRLAEQ